jgi:hypothetical protein
MPEHCPERVPAAIRLLERSEITIYESTQYEHLHLETLKHSNDLNRLETENTFSLPQEPSLRTHPRKSLATSFSPSFVYLSSLAMEPTGEPISSIATFLSLINVDMELFQCVNTKESDLHTLKEVQTFYFSY